MSIGGMRGIIDREREREGEIERERERERGRENRVAISLMKRYA